MPVLRRNPAHHWPPSISDDPYPLPDRAPPDYFPEPAVEVPDEVKLAKKNRVNQQTTYHRIIEHPIDYAIEYPETTDSKDERIAHVVPILPDAFRDPTLSSQYSWWSGGTHDHISCRLLEDDEGYAQTYIVNHKCKISVLNSIYLLC